MINMHVRTAGEAERCRVRNYVTEVNVYKFGWLGWGGGSIIENSRLRVIFRGRTHLNFRGFQRFSGALCIEDGRWWEGR